MAVISQIKKLGNYKILIGIDPDVTRSGIAVKCDGKISVGTMNFFTLYDYLMTYRGQSVLVRIEAGWLNKPANFTVGGLAKAA